MEPILFFFENFRIQTSATLHAKERFSYRKNHTGKTSTFSIQTIKNLMQKKNKFSRVVHHILRGPTSSRSDGLALSEIIPRSRFYYDL